MSVYERKYKTYNWLINHQKDGVLWQTNFLAFIVVEKLIPNSVLYFIWIVTLYAVC